MRGEEEGGRAGKQPWNPNQRRFGNNNNDATKKAMKRKTDDETDVRWNRTCKISSASYGELAEPTCHDGGFYAFLIDPTSVINW